MKVTSNKDITFPKLNWSCSAGCEVELPEDKDAQKQILAHSCIEEVGKSKSTSRREDVQNEKNI